MSDEHIIIADLRRLMQATDTRYGEIALLSPSGPDTIRLLLERGRLPSRRDARDRIVRFVVANRYARQRTDLRCMA